MTVRHLEVGALSTGHVSREVHGGPSAMTHNIAKPDIVTLLYEPERQRPFLVDHEGD